MIDTTYRPKENIHCHYWWDDPDRCWGQVELVDADYSGEGETTYMCQGHKSVYNGGDYNGEYLLPPTQENTKMNKWGSAMEIGTWGTEDLTPEEKIRYAYAQALKNLAWKIEHDKSDVTGEYVCFIPARIEARIIMENLDSKLVLMCTENMWG